MELRDQRTMVGPRVHASVAEVEFAWEEHVREHGLPIRARAGEYSRELRQSDQSLAPYVDGGRWVADCPGCRGGIACWPENPRACCLGCGTIYPVRFPSRQAIDAATLALVVRPDERRGWYPWRESVEDLERENLAHGFRAREDESRSEAEEVALLTGLPPETVERVLRAAAYLAEGEARDVRELARRG